MNKNLIIQQRKRETHRVTIVYRSVLGCGCWFSNRQCHEMELHSDNCTKMEKWKFPISLIEMDTNFPISWQQSKCQFMFSSMYLLHSIVKTFCDISFSRLWMWNKENCFTMLLLFFFSIIIASIITNKSSDIAEDDKKNYRRHGIGCVFFFSSNWSQSGDLNFKKTKRKRKIIEALVQCLVEYVGCWGNEEERNGNKRNIIYKSGQWSSENGSNSMVELKLLLLIWIRRISFLIFKTIYVRVQAIWVNHQEGTQKKKKSKNWKCIYCCVICDTHWLKIYEIIIHV